MPQILNEIVEVVKAVKTVPQERISEGSVNRSLTPPVSHSQPQILKEVVEVVKAVKNVPVAEIIPQKRIPERIVGQIGRCAGASDPERDRRGGEGSQNCPSGAYFRGVGEQIVDAPVSHSQPQILKEVVEVVKAVKNVPVAEIIPQKRIPERIVGQIDDVPVPQILKEVVEVVKAVKTVPQERISEGGR